MNDGTKNDDVTPMPPESLSHLNLKSEGNS